MVKILSFWKGNNRDRFLLFGIIGGIWLVITLLEEFVPNKYLDKLPSNVSLTLLGVVILSMIIHAIYIFVAQFHRRRNPRELNHDYKPSIDIFVSAHNEAKVIEGTLKHLLEQDYDDFRIYAINDRSIDNTLEIMEKIAKNSDGKLTIIDRPHNSFPGKAAALNTAFKISDGAVICVLDSDARIDRSFLRNIVKHLGDPMVGAVQAQKVIYKQNRNFLTKCQYHEYALDTYLQVGRDSIRGAVELRGNGQLIKREALEDVGGWNEDTLTDDLDLSTCLHVNGWDVRFSSENKVYEEAVPDLRGLIKQRKRWAEGSMRRYLNYFLQLMEPGNLSLNQIFDTFVFLSEFNLPLWLTLDVIYEVVRYINGRETYLSFLMLLSIGGALVIFVSQFNGLRIYQQQSLSNAFYNSIVTNTYLMALWISMILVSYRKILFSRTVGVWTRTEHGI